MKEEMRGVKEVKEGMRGVGEGKGRRMSPYTWKPLAPPTFNYIKVGARIDF